MIGWLLDTNVVAALSAPNGAPSVKAWASGQDERRLFISVLTLAEYDKGIHQLDDDDASRARHKATRNALEARFTGRVLSITDEIVLRWGMLAGRVRRDTGHPPPVIDTLLAATALEGDLILATRNTRDVRHTGAVVFNPWDDDPAKFALTSSSKPRSARRGDPRD